MITRLLIDNYRCFSSFEMRPARATLLLGQNGGGKSSVLDAITAIVDLTRGEADVQTAFPPATRTRWDRRPSQRVELDVAGNGGLYQYVLSVRHDDGERSRVHTEEVRFEGRVLFRFDEGSVHLHDNAGRRGASFPYKATRSFLPQIEARDATRDLMWFLTFLEHVWMLRLDARSMSRISQDEALFLDRTGANFASWYRHLSQERPERLPALWEALRPAVPGLRALAVRNAGGGARELVVLFDSGGQRFELGFDELSDGQRVLIVLYTLLENREGPGRCLLLDEPEAHVSLAEIQPWLAEMRDRLGDGDQVFVISHHPEVVDYLAADAPILLERPDAGAAVARLSPFRADQSGLTASQQLARGLLDAS